MYAVAYHGTTHNFNAFDLSHDRGNNFLGRAVYLSSEPEDCRTNYHKTGGDNKVKIIDYMETHDCTYEEAEAAVLGEGEEVLLTCAVTLKNPLDMNQYFYLEGGERKIQALINHMESLGYSFSMDKLMEEVIMPLVEGTKLQKFKDACWTCDIEHDEYKYPVGEFQRDLLCYLGYDGVIMNATETFPFMMWGFGEVIHYVVFNCNQVKIVRREALYK